mmetsp:Transcript_10611/g.28182  ORF Transcript_10611/g.28182 Transcript_10611/m.28182 type:complete len:298 (+) Transcript_10611:619-1512(+)
MPQQSRHSSDDRTLLRAIVALSKCKPPPGGAQNLKSGRTDLKVGVLHTAHDGEPNGLGTRTGHLFQCPETREPLGTRRSRQWPCQLIRQGRSGRFVAGGAEPDYARRGRGADVGRVVGEVRQKVAQGAAVPRAAHLAQRLQGRLPHIPHRGAQRHDHEADDVRVAQAHHSTHGGQDGNGRSPDPNILLIQQLDDHLGHIGMSMLRDARQGLCRHAAHLVVAVAEEAYGRGHHQREASRLLARHVHQEARGRRPHLCARVRKASCHRLPQAWGGHRHEALQHLGGEARHPRAARVLQA